MSRQPIFPLTEYGEGEGEGNGTGDTEADFIRCYTSDVATLLRRIEPGSVLAAVSALYGAWQGGKVVLFCGNGGSGASCSHIVNDFARGCGLKAICLNDCMPLVSAIANDEHWQFIFSNQVQCWADRGAVLVAVSGSGNSENIVLATSTAVCLGYNTIGLSGFDGGQLRRSAHISLHVPTDSMQQAEDVHMVLLHLLYLGLKRRIEAGNGQ